MPDCSSLPNRRPALLSHCDAVQVDKCIHGFVLTGLAFSNQVTKMQVIKMCRNLDNYQINYGPETRWLSRRIVAWSYGK